MKSAGPFAPDVAVVDGKTSVWFALARMRVE